MTFSVSAVLLLGVVAFILFRKDGLKPVHLIVCVMVLPGLNLDRAQYPTERRLCRGFIRGLKF